MNIPVDNGISGILDDQQARTLKPQGETPAEQAMGFQPGSAFPLAAAARGGQPSAMPPPAPPAATFAPAGDELRPSGAYAMPKTAPVPAGFMANVAAVSPNSYTGKVYRTELKNLAADQQRAAATDEEARRIGVYKYAAAGREPVLERMGDIKLAETGRKAALDAQRIQDLDRRTGIMADRSETARKEQASREEKRKIEMERAAADANWDKQNPSGAEAVVMGDQTYHKVRIAPGRFSYLKQPPPKGSSFRGQYQLPDGKIINEFVVDGKTRLIEDSGITTGLMTDPDTGAILQGKQLPKAGAPEFKPPSGQPTAAPEPTVIMERNGVRKAVPQSQVEAMMKLGAAKVP